MIKCIKNNGFAQIKGNEDKIIKELLNNEYYDEWEVSKTEKYVTFELFHGDEYINFDNHHETYFKNMLRPEDILLFNEAKELTHVLQNPTLQTLLHNGFHGRVLNDGA